MHIYPNTYFLLEQYVFRFFILKYYARARCIKSSPASFITKQLSLLRVSLETVEASHCLLQALQCNNHCNPTQKRQPYRARTKINPAQPDTKRREGWFTVSANYEDPIIDAAATGSDLIGRYSRGTRFVYSSRVLFILRPPWTRCHTSLPVLLRPVADDRATRMPPWNAASLFDRDSRIRHSNFVALFAGIDPMPVNRCNYASQLTATVNNARPLLNLHVHPSIRV